MCNRYVGLTKDGTNHRVFRSSVAAMRPLVAACALGLAALSPLAQADLNDGLVGYYSFDGNALDGSGNGNHGTVYGATLTADQLGNLNSAYLFNGKSSYIRVPHNSILNMKSALTLSGWINSKDMTQFDQDLISKTASGAYSLILNEGQGPENGRSKFCFVVNVLGKYHYVYSQEHLDNYRWYHVVGSYDGQKARIYVDGVLEGEKQLQGAITNTTTPLILGNESGELNEPVNGVLDDLRIYNRALTEAEVKQLAGITVAQSCKFNDLNGNGVKDPNETGLANESIFIRDNIAANYNGAGFYGRVTDSNGEFDFVAPVASNYTFWTNIPAGKVQTAPVPGESMAPYTANLAAGEALQVCFGIADKTYPLALTKSGTGQGQVTSADNFINCGPTCTANYAQNSTVTLTATPATDSQFQGWTGDCSDTLTTVTVMLDKAKTCNAIFDTVPKATLTVNKNGTGSGTVMTANFGINCGSTCQNTYPLKTPVTLNVMPGANSTFTGWSGDCSGNTPTATVTLDAAKTCTATFASTVKPMLTVSKTGQGEGSIISTPAGISCGKTCGYDFPANSKITLTAYNIAGSTFTGWSGDCSSTASKIVVILDQAKNCIANFDVKVPPPAGMYSLTVAKTGTGQGTITGSTSSINCGTNCLSNFKNGATYWLTAKPDIASKFIKWTGDCSGTNAAIRVTFTKNLTCTAEFATK